jgi:hypothetical protein
MPMIVMRPSFVTFNCSPITDAIEILEILSWAFVEVTKQTKWVKLLCLMNGRGVERHPPWIQLGD